jgi:drug/metabolite transporter (DMT)-like permease
VVGFTSIYEAFDFPIAFTILSLIGIIVLISGSIYWLFHTFTGKQKCEITKFSLPGPITGALIGLGGAIGFIGSMVFIPYGNDVTSGPITYAFGYIVPTVVFGLFLLFGFIFLFTSKKGKKSSKKKKRKR